MADVNKINPEDFILQSYKTQDTSLIPNFSLEEEFGDSSYIEFYIYDLNQNLLYQTSNYTNYKVLNDNSDIENNALSNIITDPSKDLEELGYTNGSYITYYNFLDKKIGDNSLQLYISEISTDRTELRLDSSLLSDLEIVQQTNNFISDRNDQIYFVDFYLNFGSNLLILANNIKLENSNTSDPTVLVKLYEPLPVEFDLKESLWIVTSINPPQAYEVNFPDEIFEAPSIPQLQGPNFAIPVKDQVNNSSQNLSYTDIILSSPLTSSQNQINSLLSQSAVNINVDYNNFSNFIHFSSAKTRIENFYYKLGLIETHTSESSALSNVTSSNISNNILQSKISNIIKNFDNFEYFMYYSSGSAISYPKENSIEPYILSPTTSSQVLTWLGSANESNAYYGGQILSSSNYDNANSNYLYYSIPEYLREDVSNQPYDLFVDMVAQYYDNVWLYTKDITEKYNADNRLDFGISKDLVSDAIKDFGIKLYQNNFSNQELYTAFLGLTPNGSTFPFPEITGSRPVSTGMEFVDTLISASNDVISMNDTNKSLYKRLYHNIPYLLKTKGTITGLRALITSYGIPDTILKISEFGGKDQVNANDWDLYFNNFNYNFKSVEQNFIQTPWAVTSTWGAPNSKPSTVQLRFKSEEFPPTNLSQSLWKIDESGLTGELLLDYNGSGSISGSYSGSIQDPNYQYTNLRFIPYSDEPEISASISLPFYNGDWWSVMITSNQSNTINLYAGNKIYNGNDGTSLGYYASASVEATVDVWTEGATSTFLSSSINYPSYKYFSGSLQEIRYYNQQISESVFKDFIMNPLSFEGNGVNSAPDQLIFRAALGSELDITTTSSIHPKVTGSYNITQSFTSNSNWTINSLQGLQYAKNTETFFLDQPAVGIKNRITDKIRSESDTLPSGSVLSPIRRLSQTTEASASYTDNINYLEVAFSPQNQINDDIIGQLGYFNIGDYIGDPRQRSSSAVIYPDLNNLSEEYFKKYIEQYDLTDFVRLIKFFDNSLFKMIKDFIPARTSLASGLVIKQHLLERNKYPQPQVSHSNESELSGSIEVGSFNGGSGGIFNPFNINYELNNFTITTEVNYSASMRKSGGTTPPEDSTTIDYTDYIQTTNAPDLEWFERFISSSYDGNPNLWININSGGSEVANAFNSGSGTNNATRARISDISLIPPIITLASGYQVGSNGSSVATPEFNFFTASLGNANVFFSSSFISGNNYYYDTTPQFNVTQSYTITTPSLSGSITRIHNSQNEFYNGELSGSTLIVTNGELNEECDYAKNVNAVGANYGIRAYSVASGSNFGDFINSQNSPLDGFIQTWFQKDGDAELPAPMPIID